MNNKHFATLYKDYVNMAVKAADIDTTYICPLQCPACIRQTGDEYAQKIIKSSSNMTMQDLIKIAQTSGTINFCGTMSDPIYNPEFLSFLRYLRDKNHIKVLISTTATRKKLDWWKTAFEYSTNKTNWIIGLDGIDQETANIYRVNTRYDEVMEVMKLGVELKKNIVWQFIIFGHNEHQVEEAKRMANDLGVVLRLQLSSRFNIERTPINLTKPSDKWKNTSVMNKMIYIHPVKS
jgi:MoaA/NifB/PqqE/SkfB family radical SAM enzyme